MGDMTLSVEVMSVELMGAGLGRYGSVRRRGLLRGASSGSDTQDSLFQVKAPLPIESTSGSRACRLITDRASARRSLRHG
jgi:hypothetical protein